MLHALSILFLIALVNSDRPSFADNILARSTSAEGILKCGNLPAMGAHVRLYRNFKERTEDLLDATVTKDDGSFRVEGDTVGRAQNESNIEPTLRFYHKCDVEEKKKDEYRKFSLRFNHTYVTMGRYSRRTFDAGTLNLEIVYPKEQIDKKFEPLQVKAKGSERLQMN